MRLSRLIPVCLISILMGVLLPRLFLNPKHLILAAAGYMLVMVAVDFVFGSRREER
jgi:hypothetical protein